MSGALFGIHSRRGRRVISIGALFYAAAAVGVFGLAMAAGQLGTDRLSIVATAFLVGIAASGVVVFWKLRG
jgi:hypothetical protein